VSMQTTLERPAYPFENHFLDIGGLRYHYLDEGTGDAVVMVHGNPSWSFYYRDLALALREKNRVIVPDHMGCGLSDKPGVDSYDYTLKRRVADLEALLDHLAIKENITLVVHDWGGMIGMAWAARHPERVKRLVVLNTSAFFLPKNKPFPWALGLIRNTPLGALLVQGLNAFSVGASYIGCKQNPMPGALRAAYQAPYDSWDNRIATLRFVQDIPLTPSDESYETVNHVQETLGRFKDIPMFIGWGERDFVFDGHFLAEWQRRFPNAEVNRFPKAGHYVLEDAKAELIPLIQAFLEQHP
jgi:pimeloyl-ACP methyl ester carboxylesterase